MGADRKVHGIISWMPVYSSGSPVGWTLDFMRRNTDPGTFRGVMEFLIASAALTFREEGARFVSLSGAPLARLDLAGQTVRAAAPARHDRQRHGTGVWLPVAAAFQGQVPAGGYQPLYLTYPDPAALGSIATAIGRAYLPHLTPRQALRLLTKLRRPHTSQGPVQQRKEAHPIRGDTVVTGRATDPETVASRNAARVDRSEYTELKALGSGGFGDEALAGHNARRAPLVARSSTCGETCWRRGVRGDAPREAAVLALTG